MKLIKPSFEILEQSLGEEGIYKQVEKVGRVCWKSESKITEDSYKKFVEMLKSKGHGAMLEHGTVYLKVEDIVDEYGRVFSSSLKGSYSINPYSFVTSEFYEQQPNELQSEFCSKITRSTEYITTNYRVLVENNWLDDLKYLCEPTEYHEKRVTVKFICDRGVWNEFIRHRTLQRIDDCEVYLVDYDAEQNNSFAQESTRYCNYSKDKFNNEITFIQPSWCENIEESKWDVRNITPEMIVHDSLIRAERNYNLLIKEGWKPQQARQVLPNALKTELVMTGFVSDWKHFFELRDDKDHAHPDAYTLAHPLHEEFIKRGYL